MKKTAIIYSFNTKKTSKIADLIVENFSDSSLVRLNAEELKTSDFEAYDQMILGVPTWFDGELPNYWDEFVPAIEDMDLKNKKIALYGLGDQKGYPENFQDAIGIMAELLESRGAKIVGLTSIKGYSFESSRALRGDSFLGLAIDYETQGSKNKSRVADWVQKLKKELN